MERREDIRAAIHRLLESSDSEETAPRAWKPLEGDNRAPGSLYSESQLVTFKAVQASLRAHKIEAEIPDIVNALLEALATRPALCRGLVAAYLLGA